jgi:hypothetical protein
MITPAEFQKMQQTSRRLGTLGAGLAKNKELQAGLDRQTKELHHTRQEVEIKDEALRRQSEHQKQLETEIVFVRAALAEAQERLAADPEGATWQERYAR